MTSDPISPELSAFIVGTFPSVPHLEALLLLRRDGENLWTAAGVAERLYIDEQTSEMILSHLQAMGLIARDTQASPVSYRFAPVNPTLAGRVDAVQALYSQALVAVTRLIHERSAQLFADAFRFRKG